MNNRVRTVFIATSTVLVALLLMGAVLGKSDSSDGAYRQLAVFTEVLSRIKSDYVEEPDLKNVTLGALNGLLESIDPFASYLNADQYKEYLKTNDTAKGNIGVVLSKRFGALTVVDAIPGSPAAKAGITTNDMIESIRGIGTRDMPLAYANLLLQGAPGSSIEISLLSMRHPESKKMTLDRVEIQYPKVTSKMLPDQLGYIQAGAMMPGAASQISDAIRTLERAGAQKLLLDLRHSSVGAPEEGIAVANLFEDKGLIAYLQGQRVPRKNFEADPAKAVTRLPVVLLTNRGTASGAEVAAAALLDAKRAEVVGERTYGDASVRKAINMDDGGAIILSVAKYYSPGGKAVQDTGVAPTVQVIESEAPQELEDESAPQEAAPQPSAKPEEDTILKKAIEVATKGVAAAQAEAQPGADTQPKSTVTPQNMNVPTPEPRK
jgi:carboxyl-terminal processing protease